MKIPHVDVAAALAYIAGGSLTGTAIAFGSIMPAHDKAITAYAGAITFVAGLLLRMFKNPTPPSPT